MSSNIIINMYGREPHCNQEVLIRTWSADKNEKDHRGFRLIETEIENNRRLSIEDGYLDVRTEIKDL